MKKAMLTCLTVALLSFGASDSSHAATISTYPENPLGGLSSFDYYVQTFTTPSDLTFLQNLIVNVRAEGPSVTLAIYDWSGDNATNVVQDSYADITGVPLFRTSIQTSPSTGLPAGFFDVTVHPRINLAPSSVYGIVILDESVEDSLAAWAWGLTPYDGGGHWRRISADNHWSGGGGSDLAFKAVFSAVPEPGTLTLLGLALASLAFTYRRRLKAVAPA